MVRVKSHTGKVHIKQGNDGTLCNNWFEHLYFQCQKTDEPVTCKSCLKILNQNNPNITMQQVVPPENLTSVKICFGSKINSIQEFFETKAEKAAYIKGVRDALLKIRASYVTIDGEVT